MSLSIDDVSIAFGGRSILGQVTVSVETGEVLAVVGPSGVGKSTLLRIVAGIERPDAGRIFLDGADVTDVPVHRRSIGLVFQDDQLFPHLNVAENIGFGPKMKGHARGDIAARVTELLALVDLVGFEQRRVDSLSGGEAKRVALARAMAPRPQLLLLDEPLAGLDRALHDRLVLDLRQILTTTRTTALVVTHDLDEAAHLADRIIHLSAPAHRVMTGTS